MKKRRAQRIPSDRRGAAMLAALCLAMVFAISLSSYLTLCYQSLYLSERNAMTTFRGSELAEAGVEQALYCFNNSLWTGWNLSGTTYSATMTMTSTGLSTSVGATPLDFGNGVTGTVTVTVQNYLTTPSITSTSTLSIPPAFGSGTPALIQSGTMTFRAPTSPATSAAPLFVNAVAATNGVVKFKTGGTVDSYNSNPSATGVKKGAVCQIVSVGSTSWTSIGAASNTVGTVFTASISPATATGTGTGTAYANYNNSQITPDPYVNPDYVNAGYSAVVLSQDNFTTSATVRLKDATVHGFAVGYDYSSPSTSNWLSYSGSGQLLGPNTASGTDIDSSRILTVPMPYQPVVPENLPSPTALLPKGGGTVSSDGSTINQSGTLGSAAATSPVVYSVGSGINLTTNQTVTILGPVVLISYGGVTIAGTAKIALVNPQSSLQIFLEYGSLSLGGTGITNSNPYPLPKKVAIMDTTNTWFTATIGTAQPFYGVIYLPYLPITVSNTGTGAAIYGSIVGESVDFTGADPILHYDLALRSPVSTTYLSSTPLQYGAAFSNISTPQAYSSMLLSSL